MTKAKEGREGRRLDWPAGQATTEDVISSARFWFLCVVAETFPEVLEDLITSRVRSGGIPRWADRWHLDADWCRRQAVYSLRRHRTGGIDLRRHGWGDAVEDGFTWPDDRAENMPPDVEPSFVPSPPVHKDPEHFLWLARFHVDEQSYATIAKDAGVSVPTVHEAITRTAKMIGLPLRQSRLGRPARPIS